MLAARQAYAANPRIQFVFVGGGTQVPQLKAMAQAQGLDDAVMFLPRMPMNEVGVILQAADALLVHLRDDSLFSITVPSKLQAYLFSGKPVLMAVRGDAAELVRQADAGVCAEPENAESVAQAALQLASMECDALLSMGQRGKAFYEQNLSSRVGVARLAALLEQAGNTRSGKGAPGGIGEQPPCSTQSRPRPGGVQR